MYDSAHLAVASLVQDGPVATREFNVRLTGSPASGALIARSLFVGRSDGGFLTESLLSDEDARDLGRADGLFAAEV